MLFSIVIPTYNPGDCLVKLIDSIDANYCTDDIEIIFSDDCSTEPFDDVLEKYKYLNIHKITNDKHYGFPRTGRQNGIDYAHGEWVTFIDQDDYFEEHIFDKLRRMILEAKPQNYIVTHVQTIELRHKHIVLMEYFQNGTQGKFYQKSFIDKYNIRYNENIDYDEDTDYGVIVQAILAKYDLPFVTYDLLTYNWVLHEGSLSDIYRRNTYAFEAAEDYLKCTIGEWLRIYRDCPKDDEELTKVYKFNLIYTFIKVYFEFLGFIHPMHECPPLPESYFKLIKEYFQEFKEAFNMTADEFINYIATDFNMLQLYSISRYNAFMHMPFIETMTFYTWVHRYLEGDIP